MTQTIALSYFEIAQSRLSLMEMLRINGVPMQWSFATNDYTYDWNRIREIKTWDDHDGIYIQWESK